MLGNYLLMMSGFYILSGLVIFVSLQKHFLMTLLSLEYIMLNLFMVLVMSVSWQGLEAYMSLVFLVFAVSEGSVGLSMLVSMVRTHGGDFFKSFNLLW